MLQRSIAASAARCLFCLDTRRSVCPPKNFVLQCRPSIRANELNMEPRQELQTDPSSEKEGQAPKPRFQIVKLEERIAPDKGGATNKPHPCSGTCVCGY